MGVLSKIRARIVKNESAYNFLKFSQFPPMKLFRYIVRKRNMKRAFRETASLANASSLTIETTNFCNTSCVFCPHCRMKRKLVLMKDNLFDKCVDEAMKNNISEINISMFGEPLMDKKIFDRIKCVKEKGMKVVFSTNAMLLNKENAEKLAETGIDEVTISLDACSEKTYKYIRKNGDFKKTIENIEYFIKMRNKQIPRKTKIKMGMMYMDETKKEIDNFLNYWKNKVEDAAVRRLHHWGSKKTDKKFLKHVLPCMALWQTPVVLSDGSVTVCCLDYEGALKIGDINKNSLEEIWNSEKTKALRRLHIENKRSQIPYCAQCDIEKATIMSWWYYK